MFRQVGLLLIAVLLLPSRADACSCAEALDIREAAARATAIFAGTATKVAHLEPWRLRARRAVLNWWYFRVLDDPPQWLQDENDTFYHSKAYGYRVTFRVTTVWKGGVAQEVDAYTNMASAACGFPFREGREYLVYAREDELQRGLFVSSCSRTIELGTPGSWNDMGVLHNWLWSTTKQTAVQYQQ
jgi:hypothetical protein